MDSRYFELYQRLYACYGKQDWWPADSPFEVVIGAVLTQNTRWENVEKGIERLQKAQALSPAGLLQLSDQALIDAIRPTGYYNQKAKRLRIVARWYESAGGREALMQRSLPSLRADLLSLHGIGPETADDILLYAFDQPVFVIDAYTQRLAQRFGLHDHRDYESTRASFEENLPQDLALFQEFHALIVRHAKSSCQKKPLCSSCKLQPWCPQLQ
ncbi:MAG: hypothetical protein ACWA44_06750 [Thiotrichales bacterium]